MICPRCGGTQLTPDKDEGYAFCRSRDCMGTVFVGEALGKPEKVSRPVTRGEARASDRVKR